VIDCQGRTLMPGLLDAHVHLASLDLDPVEEVALAPAVIALRIARQIEDTLQAGFTTVRDAGGLDWGFKEAVRQGLIRGPRIFISGPFLSQTGGHGDNQRPRTARELFRAVHGLTTETILADGADEVRRAAREALRRGADQIKVMASGGAASPTDELDHVQFSVDELTAAVDVAGAVGTYVLAHAYGPRAIQNCLEAGIRSIEHGNFLDEETADPHGRDRRLPGLEPVLVIDSANGELPDRPEPERLEVAERVARVRYLGERVTVLDEIRLHGVIRSAARLDGQIDGDTVVAEAAQDLAHGFDRLGMRRDGDLEPADPRRASSHPSRL